MLHSAPNFVPASPDREHRFESRTDESCRDLDRFLSVPPLMHLDANIAADDLPAIPRLARGAAAMGIAGRWFNEIAHDPFLGSALAAEHTTRAAIGTAIALAFVRSPTSLAYLAWDLARLSGGRFVLGLGTQVRAHVERRFGMPWERPAARLRDVVGAVRAVWQSWRGRTPDAFTIASSVIMVTGDGDARARDAAEARQTIAFYASTPSYRGVLAHHGWGGGGGRLSRVAAGRRWGGGAGPGPGRGG